MASTNKTTNYELSQYIGSDKPSYLNDYNQDMNRIDLGIHAAKSEADTNANAIGDLTNLTTTAKSNLVAAVNEVDSEASTANATAVQADGKADTNATAIGTLANLTTTAKSDLVSATNEVNGKVGNLTNLSTDVKTDIVAAINSIETKIEELDNYSTSETLTGKKWTNGKDIYRKTIHYTGTVGTNNGDTTTLDSISGYDEIINLSGTIVVDGHFNELPYINFTYNDLDFAHLHFYKLFELNGNISLRCFKGTSVGSFSVGDVDIVVEYTKS